MSSQPNTPQQPFRLDVPLHDLLTNGSPRKPGPTLVPAHATSETLPEPVFSQHPALLNQDDNYEEMLALARQGKRPWTAPLVMRAMNGWLFPYVRSRVLPGDFHPIIAYLSSRSGNAIWTATTAGHSTIR